MLIALWIAKLLSFGFEMWWNLDRLNPQCFEHLDILNLKLFPSPQLSNVILPRIFQSTGFEKLEFCCKIKFPGKGKVCNKFLKECT